MAARARASLCTLSFVPTTRQLAAFPCQGCGANLLVHDQQRDVVCPFCQAAGKAPRRLTEDLEHGRKLPMDVASEVQRAIDEAVEERFAPVELPGALLLGWGALCAALFAYVYHEAQMRPVPVDYAWGAGIGLLLGVLPVGWTAQWLAGTSLARAVGRATRVLDQRPLACPSCDTAVMKPTVPGTFDCVHCKASLVASRAAVILLEGPRTPRFEAAVQSALEDESWLRSGRPTRSYVLSLMVIALGVLACGYFAVLGVR